MYRQDNVIKVGRYKVYFEDSLLEAVKLWESIITLADESSQEIRTKRVDEGVIIHQVFVNGKLVLFINVDDNKFYRSHTYFPNFEEDFIEALTAIKNDLKKGA